MNYIRKTIFSGIGRQAAIKYYWLENKEKLLSKKRFVAKIYSSDAD